MATQNTEHLISYILSLRRKMHQRALGEDRVDPFAMLRLETLSFVADKKKPTMRDVADFLCITPPSATSLINGLVKSKQLQRIVDADDRRKVRLAMTPAGKQQLADGFKVLIARMRTVLSRLNGQEQQDLMRILKKLTSYS